MDGRTKRVLIFVGLSLVATATCLAGIDLDQRYGPYECNVCSIRVPNADPETKAFIDTLRAPFEIPFIDRTWVICNETACADYEVNVSGHYEGKNRRPVEGGSGSGGGGGGGAETGNNGGGYNPGYNSGGAGGGGAGGSGKVYVGDPSVVDN